MPKSATSTPSGSSRPASRFTTSTPKPSSPRNMLPRPAMRMRLGATSILRVQRHDLLGGEEEPVPEDAVSSQIPARVVLQRHRDVNPVLVVLLYGLDERGLPGERKVHDVTSGAGPEHDPASLLELNPVHDHALERGPPLLLPEKVHPLLPQHPEFPDGPVQVHEFLRREGFASLQDLARPRVGGAHLFFLLVREGENVQNKQLVYLSPVEQVAGALGGDLGVVVEDYGGGEHLAPIPFLPHQDRPRLEVLASSYGFAEFLRRVRQRDELSSLHRQRRVGRDEGLPERALPVLALPWCGVGDPDRQPVDTLLEMLGLYLHRSAQRAPPAHQGAHGLSGGISQRFLAAPTGDVHPHALGRLQLGELEPCDRNLPLDRLVPRQVEVVPDPQFFHEFQRRDVAGNVSTFPADLPLDDVQEADVHLDGGSFVSRDQALGLHEPGVILAPGLAIGTRVYPAERPALLVLSRRAAVGPEYVPFVKHRLGDLLRRVHLALHLLLVHADQRLHGGLPGREPPANLILVEPVEGVSAKPDPGAVGKIVLYHLLPQPDRQPELCLFLPGDPGGL